MRNLLAGRAAALFAAAATILVTGAGTAQAQSHVRYEPAVHVAASAQSSARARFACHTRTVCLFKFKNEAGPHRSFPAGTNHSRCESATVDGEHAGSVNNDTNSVIAFYDNTTGHAICFGPGKLNLNHAYGEWELFYNVHKCPQTIPAC
jgi:hypothetical protein